MAKRDVGRVFEPMWMLFNEEGDPVEGLSGRPIIYFTRDEARFGLGPAETIARVRIVVTPERKAKQ